MSEKVRQPPAICRSAASSSAISASISCRSRSILALVARTGLCSVDRFAVTSTSQLYAAGRRVWLEDPPRGRVLRRAVLRVLPGDGEGAVADGARLSLDRRARLHRDRVDVLGAGVEQGAVRAGAAEAHRAEVRERQDAAAARGSLGD